VAQKHVDPTFFDTGEVHGHLPHRIWLKFIENRFSVVRHNNPTQLGIYVYSRKMVDKLIDTKRNTHCHVAQSRC
jgi:hypothetical protein